MKFICKRLETGQTFEIDWDDAKSVEDVATLFRSIYPHTAGTWCVQEEGAEESVME